MGPFLPYNLNTIDCAYVIIYCFCLDVMCFSLGKKLLLVLYQFMYI